VLDPGRSRTKTGRLWCYAVDDRPWCGPSYPAAAYVYSEDRKGARPSGHLAAFRGVLQVAAYVGFKRLAGDRADDDVRLAFCWTHTGRPSYEFSFPRSHHSPPRAGAHRQTLRDRGRNARPSRRTPNADEARTKSTDWGALHALLQDYVSRVSTASDLAKAIRYALRHWPGLMVFLEDGRVEMETNVVERAIRPNTLARKNALFAGSDRGARHWAIAMTLIQTAKINGIDSMAWLTDVLERIVSGRTKVHELHTLPPWNWYPNNIVELAEAA
jgi:transposase